MFLLKYFDLLAWDFVMYFCRFSRNINPIFLLSGIDGCLVWRRAAHPLCVEELVLNVSKHGQIWRVKKNLTRASDKTNSRDSTSRLYHPKFIPKLFLRLLWLFWRWVCLFRQNRGFPQLSSILLRFEESWNPTNCEKFNADGSLMGRTNLDKSVW